MKKNHFELKNYVMATGVFILAVIAGILIFFECVQRAVQVNSQNTLKINVQRQSEHLRTILDINYQYLNEIASAMGKSEELFSEENKEQLISIYEKTDLERAALIDKNGDAYYDNGVTKNVSHRRYFQEAISGEQTISDPLESSVDHKVRVVLGVPVYKDHKVIGVLGGSCNVTALSHMLFNDLLMERETVFWPQVMERSLPLTVVRRLVRRSHMESIFLNITEKKISKESMLFRIFRKILKLAKVVW